MNRLGTSKVGHDDRMQAPASILIVEEQARLREFMATVLRREGHYVQESAGGQGALKVLSNARFDLVITDFSLSDVDGTELVETIKRMAPAIEVVLTSSESALDQRLAAAKKGAYDILMKPFPSDRLILTAHRALERKSLVEKVRALEETIRDRTPFEGIVGKSRALTDLLKIVNQVARLENSVLVSGERGTGKELIARALHALSSRNQKPFAVINCEAISEGLRDDEDHGQTDPKPDGGDRLTEHGLFEKARGGTLYLDDVTELTPAAQQTMLRFLQNGEARPGEAPLAPPLDVRVIAATRRDLEKCVEAGTFNEDLYYRLNVISLRVPPLRERTEDIPLLARHFLRRAVEKQGGGQPAISARAMSVLTAHPWQDNVGELEGVIEQAAALDRDGVIGLDDLTISDTDNVVDKVIDRAKSGSMTLNELEREYILEILTECGGSRKKTAAKLGITTATLWRKLKRFEKG